MSRQLGRSIQRNTRGGGGQASIDTNTVYEYVLRCAILAASEDVRNAAAAEAQAQAQKERDQPKQHTAIGLDNIVGAFTDLFADDNNKPNKLSKELCRGLSKRIEEVTKRRDTSNPSYQDPQLLTALSQFQGPLNLQKSKPSGTINDLLLIFIKTSQHELLRAYPPPQPTGDKLNTHLAAFAGLLKETIIHDAPHFASPDIVRALEGFAAFQPKAARNDLGVSSRRPNTSSSPTSGPTSFFESTPLVKTVQDLFQVPQQQHTDTVRRLQSSCTEQALLADIKKCLNNVATKASFPASPVDFPTPQAYENWRRRELNQLQGLIKSLIASNPQLSLTNTESDMGSMLTGGSRPHSIAMNRNQSDHGADYRASMTVNSAEMQDSFGRFDGGSGGGARPGEAFTFIPSDPKGYYRVLLTKCIEYDLSTPGLPGGRNGTTVLSRPSEDVLKECFLRWRLMAPYRAILYLELVKQKYDAGLLQFEDLQDAMKAFDNKSFKELDLADWTINDREYLLRVFEQLNNVALTQLSDALENYYRAKPEWIDEILGVIEKIYENPIFLEAHPHPGEEFADPLLITVEGAAVTRWYDIDAKASKDQTDDLSRLISLAEKLLKELDMLLKRFGGPIMGVIFVPGIALTKQIPYFTLEMENWAHSPNVEESPIDITFELYHKVSRLKQMYLKHGPRQKAVNFKVESWFLLHVGRWLKTTDSQTPEWVKNAIAQDKFKMETEGTEHSSSVVDLFTVFHQTIDFVQALNWPNMLHDARFKTMLSKVICKALDQYCATIESLFMEDLFPRSTEQTERPGLAIQNSWYNRAITLYTASTKETQAAQPYYFTPEICVKINDIEAARNRLDKLYKMIDVDEVATVMREQGPAVPEKTENSRYLYSIKIVLAENLRPMDNNGLSDPYVILEANGRAVARTLTVYETLNPRWDQVFDISLDDGAIEVLAMVMDEDVLGADKDCGGAWFKLSPKYFDDYQTHEVWLTLDTQGRLLLRISMEGEKDDIQFWFGKAFRSLKRTEDDMTRTLVEKMSGYIKYCLSMKTINKLLGRDRKLTDYFIKAAPKASDLTLQDCDDSLEPLLDFFERNLKTWTDNLAESVTERAVLKVWKEILMTLENLLVPPLSDEPSAMKPLDPDELHIVLKWLELLKIYFNGGHDGDGISIEKLENTKYHELLIINTHYDKDTEALMQTYTAEIQAQSEVAPAKAKAADRSKSVYQSRNLGTIKGKRNTGRRRPDPTEMPQGEAILRILRMRTGKAAKDFLRLQFELKDQAHIDSGNSTTIAATTPDVPPVPPLPNMGGEPQMGADGQWVPPTKSLSSANRERP